MAQHTDFRSDRSLLRTSEALRILDNVPDYVKPETRLLLQNGPVDHFADPATGNYPCHNKTATWWSAVAYYHNGDDRPDVGRRIRETAEYFNIGDDVAAVEKRYTALHKAAAERADDANYLLVWQDEADQRTRREFLLKTPEGVQKAAEWFAANCDEFKLDDRTACAAKLLKAADDHQATLPDRHLLEQLAGIGWSTPEHVAWELQKRATMLPQNPLARSQLQTLAATVAAAPQEKLASAAHTIVAALDTIDNENRLVDEYKRGLSRPTSVCYTITPSLEKSGRAEFAFLSTGHIFSKAALAAIPTNTADAVLGPKIGEAICDATGVNGELLEKWSKTAGDKAVRGVVRLLTPLAVGHGSITRDPGLFAGVDTADLLAEEYGPVFPRRD